MRHVRIASVALLGQGASDLQRIGGEVRAAQGWLDALRRRYEQIVASSPVPAPAAPPSAPVPPPTAAL